MTTGAASPSSTAGTGPLITETANAYAQFIAQNVIAYTPSARDALTLRADAPQALMKASEIAD